MKKDLKRVQIALPPIPHSLRDLIERIACDERAFQIFMDSPVRAMKSAGVPIETDELPARDCVRIIKVLAKLRQFLAKARQVKDFRFEDFFQPGDPVSTQTKSQEQRSCENAEWDQSKPERTTDRRSNECKDQGFNQDKKGLGWMENDRWIDAPMLSPSDLSEIFIRMDVNVDYLIRASVKKDIKLQ